MEVACNGDEDEESVSLCVTKINLPKELRSLPCQGGKKWGGIKKSCVWVLVTTESSVHQVQVSQVSTSVHQVSKASEEKGEACCNVAVCVYGRAC